MKHKLLAVMGILTLLMGLLPGAVFAASQLDQVVVPVPGGPLTVNIVTVNDGAGGQTDPHVSGDWVSYTDNSVFGIRFQNLDLGVASDRLIPRPDGYYYDSLSDISANTIVFMRATDSGSQGIYLSQIDPFGDPGPIVELSPSESALRRRSVIGGDTIAYEDRGYDSSSSAQPEIALSSATDPTAPAYRLTNDTLSDQSPAVSPDGNTVVWVKCVSATACDIWRAERTNGAWGTPEQVTGADGNEALPDTNGPVTVYNSDAGGDVNIHWSMKDSSAYVESVLALPGVQRNPNIAGNLISFESSAAPGAQFDLWLYDLATNRLYQLTDTSVSESLSDVTTGPGDLVRVVWTQPKQIYPYDLDVYAMSFIVDHTPPVITPDIQGTQGADGWYTGDVSLTWSATEDLSQITDETGCDPVTITSDQAATDYTCSATSSGGTSSETAPIKRDGTNPVTSVTNVTDGATYTLGSVPQAGCSSTDNLSGVATEATLTLTGGDAQGAGNITATCSGALDAAGNAADPAVVHYTVNSPSNTYNFTGFFQPVENLPVVNTMKAGAAVPITFSLGGDQGLDIFATGFPKSQPVSCSALSPLSDPVEITLTAGSSSLSYDPVTDQYTYVWKTTKGWAGTCRVLTVELDDGTQHLAYFQFK